MATNLKNVELRIPYGNETQSVSLPRRILLDILKPPAVEPFQDVTSALRLMASAATDFLDCARRVLLLINDATRPTPTSLILSALAPMLRGRSVRILVALGAHSPVPQTELMSLIGDRFSSGLDLTVLQHNSRNTQELLFMGRTKAGTDVHLNREIAEFERIIVVGSVEPHYFAGFTGGRKSILPGIAGFSTIVQNHHLAVFPGASPLSLEHNPVHRDMIEAAGMVHKPIFSIQAVQDHSRRLLSIRYGNLSSSFMEACADARMIYALPVQEKADIVLSVLRPPADINLYQSQRAVEFALPILKPPSVHISVTRCRNGVGNNEFIRILRNCDDPAELLERPRESRDFGWHKAVRLARIMQRTRLFAITDLDPQTVRSVFMTPFSTVQDAIDAAINLVGHDARAYVIPDASSVVPVCMQ